ncbi:uncharacterized protein LOC119834780 [Zerene cesonia]|uniref:uncharacterized protein LOC119834780 n=1 Tax=Zerene cesonia TaxID=33412 RepID=UPI0018E4E8A2|nr:uncharacterized protein LOC119834780 [Zerene cesonia]
MSGEAISYDDVSYVDVNALPLKPPQPFVPPDKAVRRAWHPVMWDDSNQEDQSVKEDEEEQKSKEYPHKKQIRNIKRLVAEGKLKPTPETLIFFLCNKFAISEERQAKMNSG